MEHKKHKSYDLKKTAVEYLLNNPDKTQEEVAEIYNIENQKTFT